jgi:hypothetical protein
MPRSAETPSDAPDAYRARWRGWVSDPLLAKAGITFDRTPSGLIVAPASKFRVCAYHIDFDERPTCWLDVETLAEAHFVCEHLRETGAGWSVDYAIAYDDAGRTVIKSPYAE